MWGECGEARQHSSKEGKERGKRGRDAFFKCSVRFWDQSCARQEANAMQSAWWMRRFHGCWDSTKASLHLPSMPSPRPLGHCRTHFISHSLFFPLYSALCPRGIYESDFSRPWWMDFLCNFYQFMEKRTESAGVDSTSAALRCSLVSSIGQKYNVITVITCS